jgi:hypothetical protein
MSSSQIRQEMMEVATSNLKGKAMANKLAEVMVNPEEKDEPNGVEPISHLMKSPY